MSTEDVDGELEVVVERGGLDAVVHCLKCGLPVAGASSAKMFHPDILNEIAYMHSWSCPGDKRDLDA